MPPTLLIVALLAGAPAPPEVPPPEASAQLELTLISMFGEVWGGDGDHTPVVWTLHVELQAHNAGVVPVTVRDGSFVLPLSEGDIHGRFRGPVQEIPPGTTAPITLEGHVPLPLLTVLREDAVRVQERTLRTVSGQLDLEIEGRPCYAPLTVSGRYRGVFDQARSSRRSSAGRRGLRRTDAWSAQLPPEVSAPTASFSGGGGGSQAPGGSP